MDITFIVFIGLVFYAIAWIVYFLTLRQKHQSGKDPSKQYRGAEGKQSLR